jgi:VanZ family protein
MVVIFMFSTELFASANTTPFLAPWLANLLPEISAAAIEFVVLGIRKLGHWSEYFILAVLLMRALNADFFSEHARRLPFWSIVLTTLYAATDELHQSFVPSRSASVIDVAIDSFGAVCGTLCFHLRNRRSN